MAFPLSEQAVRLVKMRARLTPHGKGEETLVDRAARDTWELQADQVGRSVGQRCRLRMSRGAYRSSPANDRVSPLPAQVTFIDAQWENGLLALVERVVRLLGHEPGSVSATLCKALLSTPGGHFLPHQASWLAADSFRAVRDGSFLR